MLKSKGFAGMFLKESAKRGLSKKEAEELGKEIEQVVASSFPHNDPIDQLGPWVEQQFGVKGLDVGDLLDIGVKTLGKYKDFKDYQNKMRKEYS